MSTEIIFEVTDDADGGYNATALGFGIHTQADSMDALESAARDAVATYFDDSDLHVARLIGLNRPS